MQINVKTAQNRSNNISFKHREIMNLSEGNNPENTFSLFSGCCHNQIYTVQHFLGLASTNVNLKNKAGSTPLLAAVEKGLYRVVELLLTRKDIDVNLPNADGVTPLFIAAKKGYHEIVKLLLKIDNINVDTVNGFNPLFIATQNGHWEVVKILMTSGADCYPTLMNLFQTVITLKSEGKYDEVINLYEKAMKIEIFIHGEQSPTVARTLEKISEVYQMQAKYDEAFKLYRKILEIYKLSFEKTAPGEYRLCTARILKKMADLCKYQGKKDEEFKLYEDSLKVYKVILGHKKAFFGDRNYNVATALRNVANVYKAQENYDEAIKLYREALEILEDENDPDAAADTAETLNDIAVCIKLGKDTCG